MFRLDRLLSCLDCCVSQESSSTHWRSANSFDALIGCPLQGGWNIQIHDEQGHDEGLLYQWRLVFANETLCDVTITLPSTISISVYPYLYIPIYISIYLSVYVLIYPNYLMIYLSIIHIYHLYIRIYLSIYLLSVYLSINLPIVYVST